MFAEVGYHDASITRIAQSAGLAPGTFYPVARAAVEASDGDGGEIGYLCPIHVKRSLHQALLDGLGLSSECAVYLEDTGHMSGVDPLLGFDRARRCGAIADGQTVLLLAAGTGHMGCGGAARRLRGESGEQVLVGASQESERERRDSNPRTSA